MQSLYQRNWQSSYAIPCMLRNWPIFKAAPRILDSDPTIRLMLLSDKKAFGLCPGGVSSSDGEDALGLNIAFAAPAPRPAARLPNCMIRANRELGTLDARNGGALVSAAVSSSARKSGKVSLKVACAIVAEDDVGGTERVTASGCSGVCCGSAGGGGIQQAASFGGSMGLSWNVNGGELSDLCRGEDEEDEDEDDEANGDVDDDGCGRELDPGNDRTSAIDSVGGTLSVGDCSDDGGAS